ncbi:MAG: hypothetical protein KBT03_10845 [Bacteroidales bacterium]|nr:hypothetical protein [Candidatus Scybalousia scybalohippi]
MIKGETIILKERVETGIDDFGAVTYETTDVEIKDVVIGSPSFDQSVTEMQLTGKRLAYVLGIPKGDTHNWKDTEVVIRGERFKTYGFPLTQTESNVPGKWNTQVKVERYE